MNDNQKRDFGFWWRMIRPHTLSASSAPVFIGTAFAMQASGHLKTIPFLAMLFATFLIQIAANLFNEYFDFIHGLDKKESVGNSGTIVRDGASPRFVLGMAILAYGLAMLLGIYLAWVSSWWLLLVGALCMLIGILYAGGPHPLSRTPFGELFAGGVMGCGLVLISGFIQMGQVPRLLIWVSIPSFILVGLILTANNLRDRVGDAAHGRRTLVILLGHKRSVYFLLAGIALAYLWLVLLLFQGLAWPVLLPLFALPRIPQIIRPFSGKDLTPPMMMPGMVAMSKLNRDFGFYLAVGLLIIGYLH